MTFKFYIDLDNLELNYTQVPQHKNIHNLRIKFAATLIKSSFLSCIFIPAAEILDNVRANMPLDLSSHETIAISSHH